MSDNESDYSFSFDNQVEELYGQVKTFDDLLDINVKFLQNKIPHTYYYLGHFGENCGETHKSRRDALILLHTKYRVYTYCGQSNICQEHSIQQSYLDFLVEPTLAAKIESLLFQSELIYTSTKCHYRYDDNFPTRKYNLTRYYNLSEKTWNYPTNWWRDNDYSEAFCTSFANLDELLYTYHAFCIVVKDPTSKEADLILKDILDSL